MAAHNKDYEIYNSVLLDDVMLAADFPDGKERLRSSGFWEKLTNLSEEAGLTYQGVGPSEFLKQAVGGCIDQELPIVLKLSLLDDCNAIGLAYLYDSNVEIHLPENYLLTGFLKDDASRNTEFWRVAKSFGKAIDVTWSYIEWAGQMESDCLNESIITRHQNSLYERAECNA